ncbi:MAG: hypothetical protein AAFO03_11135 [Bacteroidota bacterium]
MLPGHSKIPEHSGTDFKHRKAFSKARELLQKKIPKRSPSSTSPKAPYRSAYAGSGKLPWVLQFIGALVALGAIITLGYVLISNYYADPPFAATSFELKQQQIKAEKERAYQIMVDTGNGYLAHGEPAQAHLEFAQALRIDEYGKDARVGLTKALILRCRTEGKYCEVADDNLAYVLKMKYAVADDFDFFLATVTPVIHK